MERAKCIERIRKEVEYFKQNYPNDNSAFLIWFLKNIYCLSEQDSVDAVCDGQRDKGIDAIYKEHPEVQPIIENLDTIEREITEWTSLKQ